eukprot:Pgem_evm2s19912
MEAALKHNKTLRTFYIEGAYSFHFDDDVFLEALAEAIKVNKTLITLDIDDCPSLLEKALLGNRVVFIKQVLIKN